MTFTVDGKRTYDADALDADEALLRYFGCVEIGDASKATTVQPPSVEYTFEALMAAFMGD